MRPLVARLVPGRPAAMASSDLEPVARRLRVPALVWAALGVQVALGLAPLSTLPGGARFGLVVASYGVVGLWLALNAATHRTALRAALGLLAAGWLLNFVVMVPNGGMPVSAGALKDSAGACGPRRGGGAPVWKHVEPSPSTVFPGLGDVVAVPALRSAVSAGDSARWSGWPPIAAAMVRHRPHARRPTARPARSMPPREARR